MADAGTPGNGPNTSDELHSIAVWLHVAARELGQTAVVRSVIRRAAETATGMYVPPGADQLTEPVKGDWGADVVDALGRFASLWDELEREPSE